MEKYRFFVSTNNFDGKDILVNSLEELFDVLKVAKNEWKEDHIHLEMNKIQEGTGNSIKMYEVIIPFKSRLATYCHLD